MWRWLAGCVACLVLLAGCDDDRDIFNNPKDQSPQQDRKEVAAEIAKLANGKDHSNIEASAIYSQTVTRLSARGTAIEPQLIESLLSDNDWSVRLGCVEVLESIGTKASVEALIGVLDDSNPLVSRRAEKLLEQMCIHQEIPETGKPIGANGLPPVPKRDPKDPKDLPLDTEEKLWAEWHRDYRGKLKKAWAGWWKVNKDKIKIN